MESSGLGSGFLPGPSGGISDLGSSFCRHQQTQLGHPSLTQQRHMNMLSGLENDYNPTGLMEGSNPTLCLGKGKAIGPSNTININDLSEDDEPNFTEDGSGENIDGMKGKKGSPWQRMKWNDDRVRLLITVVGCVGDDGTLDDTEGHKRKSVVLQKKGKWKTVSKIMIRNRCHVSPQQCEDKFNDLNKRYKRLNDILGRGNSSKVVENPALMDSMPHLSAKAKDDVRKILSSKHLFFKEMCAYHNGQRIPNCQELTLQGYVLHHGRSSKHNNGLEEENAGEDNETEDDESDGGDDDNADWGGERKLSEEEGSQPIRLDKLEVEMARVLQDPTKSLSEQTEWIKNCMLQLQEQGVSYEDEALELEKQRFKWLRYSSKKNRELERLRLENERIKLENERRILQLRQKELELEFRSEDSANPTSLGIDRVQGRDHIDLGRRQ
ncbi:Sequence-specific DNA binding transcription factor [Quillaja saponaria]|uniref:Sequence-specific DNA binding transcription factor n=1 Tax=Quillaja saponaria TaxID=32244 RepID=A0AAD7KXQ3_QUISA|nr:Sequence-specific DNA binding transcription factor [Quillaja saponaria]KAJ7947544.1 Sequence-specific DNA binding transcription factor [Quillaja saponaria]